LPFLREPGKWVHGAGETPPSLPQSPPPGEVSQTASDAFVADTKLGGSSTEDDSRRLDSPASAPTSLGMAPLPPRTPRLVPVIPSETSLDSAGPRF
jgi:hypothetical protein